MNDIHAYSVPLEPGFKRIANPPVPLVMPNTWQVMEALHGIKWAFGWDKEQRIWVRNNHKHIITGAKKLPSQKIPLGLRMIITVMDTTPGWYYSVCNTYAGHWVIAAVTNEQWGQWRYTPHILRAARTISKNNLWVPRQLDNTITDGTFDIRSPAHNNRPIRTILVLNETTQAYFKLFMRT